MKRVFTSLGATVIAVVALLGFKTHTPTVARAATASTTTTTTGNTAASAGTTATTVKATAASKTITGSSIATRWGPVQVKISVSGSKITAIDVVDYPQNNNRDISINSYAVPQLVSQALSAQSASIDGISGATYTTTGFEQSLQSAIAKI